MNVFRLRARIALALGLPGFVGTAAAGACAPNAPPENPEPVATDAQEPIAVAPPTATFAEPPPGENDAAVALVASDASADVEVPPPPPPPPPPRREPPRQKSAWHATFKLPPGTERWCTHGSVQCHPASTTIGAPGATTGALKCPSAVEVACPCTPAGCNDFGGLCVARLHKNVSLRERATHQDACCYELPRQCVPPYVGRPLRNGELLVHASPEARSDWRADIDRSGLGPDPARAELWTAIAGLEHSSIASFAKVTLELLALGAPAQLIADVQRAALDEIVHAQLAYAVASASGAGDVGPGPLQMPSIDAPDLPSFAVATFRDGCVEETTGAIVARELAERESNDSLRSVLERIANDEERHAELAWRMLAWTVSTGGAEVHAALSAELVSLAAVQRGEDTRAQVSSQLVRPCLAALLDRRAPRDSNPRPSDPKSEALSS